MKEKDDKLQLVKQILLDQNGIDPTMILQKDPAQESATKTTSDTDIRTSRKVMLCFNNTFF